MTLDVVKSQFFIILPGSQCTEGIRFYCIFKIIKCELIAYDLVLYPFIILDYQAI